MSFPIFSQSDTVNETLVCIPTIQAKQVVRDLINYDLCKMERDSLLLQVNDLSSIVEQNNILIDRFKTTTDSLMFINQELVKFEYKTLDENLDAIITDVPEPWEFFTNNKIKNSVTWVSYLPSMTQVMRMNDELKEQQFQDIEIKEVILRDWVVDEKIVRPSNKLVSHTGFLISAKYIKY